MGPTFLVVENKSSWGAMMINSKNIWLVVDGWFLMPRFDN
jgi:hypothetical protein